MTPPTGVHALVMDGDWALAFAGGCLFEYDATTLTWSDKGYYVCPPATACNP